MALKINDLPNFKKPREKMLELGSSNLMDHELLSIILNTGCRRKSVLALSLELLEQHPLAKITTVKLTQLSKIKGIGQAKACKIKALAELSQRLNQANNLIKLNQPEKVFHHLSKTAKAKQEHTYVFYLNGRQELLQKKLIALGSLNQTLIEPKEILAPALCLPASSLILAHNHPSGDPTASQADIIATNKLLQAAQLMGVQLMDHVIIAQNKYFSFRERGLLTASC